MKLIKIFILILLLSYNVFASESELKNKEKLVNKSEEIVQSLREKTKEKSKDLLILADMLKTYSQGGKETLIKNIVNFSQEMKDFEVIRLVDQKGKEVIKVINGTKIDDLKDESTRDYFKTIIKSKVGQVYISPVVMSEITNKPIIKLATPLANLSEINKAVLELDLNLNEIIALVNNAKIGSFGQSYLISFDGIFITHQDREKILKENINKFAGSGFESIFKKIRNFEKGWGEYVYNNEDYIISYAPFQEMGWISTIIISRKDFEQLELKSVNSAENEETKQKLNSVSSTQNLSLSPTSYNDSPEMISATTLKLLDGSLRTKTIDSYRATVTFIKKMEDGSHYSFKINLQAKDTNKSDYSAFFQQNKNKIISLIDMDESVFRKIKFEIVSPSFLQKNKIINENLVMMYLPLKNEIIRMSRNELVEYETIFSEKEKKYLKLFTNMDFKEFSNDRFDIKIDEQGTLYMVELKLKKTILSENELIRKLKLWIRGDYFFPVKYEWLNEKDEIVISVLYDNLEINIPIEDNLFVFNPSEGVVVKNYEELKKTFLEENKITDSDTQIKDDTVIKFAYKEIRDILYEEFLLLAKNIAESLSIASLDFVETSNYNKLLNYVNIAMKNKDIMYIMILADNGEKVIFKSQPEFDGLNLNSNSNIKVKEISHPILLNDKIIGSVRMGINLNKIDEILKTKLIQDSKQVESKTKK